MLLVMQKVKYTARLVMAAGARGAAAGGAGGCACRAQQRTGCWRGRARGSFAGCSAGAGHPAEHGSSCSRFAGVQKTILCLAAQISEQGAAFVLAVGHCSRLQADSDPATLLPQARTAEDDLAAAIAARDAALLEARHTAEAAASTAATAAHEADALRAGAGDNREQALAVLQARP